MWFDGFFKAHKYSSFILTVIIMKIEYKSLVDIYYSSISFWNYYNSRRKYLSSWTEIKISLFFNKHIKHTCIHGGLFPNNKPVWFPKKPFYKLLSIIVIIDNGIEIKIWTFQTSFAGATKCRSSRTNAKYEYSWIRLDVWR